jgi:hypothetical protein
MGPESIYTLKQGLCVAHDKEENFRGIFWLTTTYEAEKLGGTI